MSRGGGARGGGDRGGGDEGVVSSWSPPGRGRFCVGEQGVVMRRWSLARTLLVQVVRGDDDAFDAGAVEAAYEEVDHRTRIHTDQLLRRREAVGRREAAARCDERSLHAALGLGRAEDGLA